MKVPTQRQESTQSDTNINSLPEELILKIVQLSASEGGVYNHNFILNVIGNISSRFRRISTDSSLWRGSITIKASDQDALKRVLEECIYKGTKCLNIRTLSGNEISKSEVLTIFWRCPNLEGLDVMFRQDSWPVLPSPWKSMRRLSLHLTKVLPNPKFGRPEFHCTMPYLAELTVCTPRYSSSKRGSPGCR